MDPGIFEIKKIQIYNYLEFKMLVYLCVIIFLAKRVFFLDNICNYSVNDGNKLYLKDSGKLCSICCSKWCSVPVFVEFSIGILWDVSPGVLEDFAPDIVEVVNILRFDYLQHQKKI